jgi:agmatinase
MGFLGFQTSIDKASVLLLPVPYEQTTTFGSGTRFGPDAILNASAQVELYDIETGWEPCETGIHTLPPMDLHHGGPEQMIGEITAHVSGLPLEGKILVALGGEHSITVGIVRGLGKFYDDFTVVQLDAHADLRDSYLNTPYSHACTMRRIVEERNIVQAGIRSMSKEEALYLESNSIPCFGVDDIRSADGLEKIMSSIPDDLVYLTVDVDFFDPSVIPATGTPEPGGATWADALNLIEILGSQKRIIGFDLSELSPIAGLIYPEFTAAKLCYKIISIAARSLTGDRT